MSTIQPIWITPAGSLGTVPEGAYYSVPLQVDEPGGDQVYFKVIAGALPSGIEVTQDGYVQGVPTGVVTVAQEAIVTGADVTSKFAVRAYTTKTVGSVTVVNRLADRTFTLTVAGQTRPEWITPAGSLGEFWVGELLQPGLQLEFTNDPIAGLTRQVTLISGSLPTGLSITNDGLITGFIDANPNISTLAGFSRNGQGFDQYPFDFDTQSPSYTYEFTLKLTDGRTSSLQTFSMFVWSTQAFQASETLLTGDNTYIQASASTSAVPVLLNPPGSIGSAPSNTFYAYQFIGRDVNNDEIGYQGYLLPPGLTLDPNSGWLYGFLPDVGLTTTTYTFKVKVYQKYNTEVSSDIYVYSLTVYGPISSDVTWLTPADLGTIENGGTSIFYVAAKSTSNLPLQYKLLSGSDSRLPQGLTLLPSGNIVGRVSFNMFELDNGTTTFDNNTTTFDQIYTFTVVAYSSNGYVNTTKTFTITVDGVYKSPYNNLYIKCMPPLDDRDLLGELLENVSIFPPALMYRYDDPNFGVSKNVNYYHAYGLDAKSVDTYIQSLELNHYWKNLVLGNIKTAQALDPVTNEVIYEVVYSEVVDNLVNNEGESVGKQVVLPYPLNANTPDQINDVYPNALVDMRDQVIDVVGQTSKMLPMWMWSKQVDGNVLGFTPAWIIAYTKPGYSGQIAYNIATKYATDLNVIDFKADRYELDCALTVNWDGTTQSWIPSPPISTTFDVNYHYTISLQSLGTGYRVGDQLIQPGSTLGGSNTINDLLITVTKVYSNGGIEDFIYTGTSVVTANGDFYNNLYVAGGHGTGALWNITVVPGYGAEIPTTYWINNTATGVLWTNNSGDQVLWSNGTGLTTIFDTVFDGGSLTFDEPADEYNNTDAYNKYLLYPKQNILG